MPRGGTLQDHTYLPGYTPTCGVQSSTHLLLLLMNHSVTGELLAFYNQRGRHCNS